MYVLLMLPLRARACHEKHKHKHFLKCTGISPARVRPSPVLIDPGIPVFEAYASTEGLLTSMNTPENILVGSVGPLALHEAEAGWARDYKPRKAEDQQGLRRLSIVLQSALKLQKPNTMLCCKHVLCSNVSIAPIVY